MQLTPLKMVIFCLWHHVRSHKLALWLQFFHQISTNVHSLDQRLSSDTLISFFFPKKKSWFLPSWAPEPESRQLHRQHPLPVELEIWIWSNLFILMIELVWIKNIHEKMIFVTTRITCGFGPKCNLIPPWVDFFSSFHLLPEEVMRISDFDPCFWLPHSFWLKDP